MQGIESSQAIQLGLMALGGYFDSSVACGVRIGPMRPEPDWIVSRIEHFPHDRSYPFRVEGVNLNLPESDPDRLFSWRVPALGWRYDLGPAFCCTCTAMRDSYAPPVLRRIRACAGHVGKTLALIA